MTDTPPQPAAQSGPGDRHATAAAAIAAATALVLAGYDRTDLALVAALTRLRETWPSEPAPVRRRRAAAFAASAVSLVDQLDADTDRVVTTAVRHVAVTAHAVTAPALPGAATVDPGIPAAAVAGLVADLRAAASYLLSTARALARALQRAATAETTPTAPVGAAEAVDVVLRDRPLTAVVYRNGARHGLADYARMATRTRLAETWQRVTLDLYGQAGIRYVEVVDGAGCGWTSHDDPDKANGTIRSLEEAGAYPLAHPNCVRSSFPRADVRTVDDARHAAPLGSVSIPDDVTPGDRSLVVRTGSGALDMRALAVLAPAAARHALMLARVQARNVAAEGDRAVLAAGTRRPRLATPKTRVPGPGGTP